MIYLVRHGQTDWNILKKVMGRCDEVLNEKGKKQALQTKDKLSDIEIDFIISSPLLRTKETSIIINKDKNVEIIYDDRIIERDFGEFEGMETKKFDFLGFWDYYKNKKYKRAENIQVFFKRVYSFLDEVCTKYKDKNILVVAHGGVSIPFYCYFNNNIPKGSLIDFVLENCEVATYNQKDK